MIPKFIVIHHSATDGKRTTFEAVDRYHKSLGWGKIGYQKFVTRDGKLHEGRFEDEVGAHCRADDMNFKSIGICLAGNFETETPSTEQFTTLKSLLEYLQQKYQIPNERILGHREVKDAKTLCPGKNLLPFIELWRKAKGGDEEMALKELVDDVIHDLRKLEKEVRESQNAKLDLIASDCGKLRKELEIERNLISGVSRDTRNTQKMMLDADKELSELRNDLRGLRDRILVIERKEVKSNDIPKNPNTRDDEKLPLLDRLINWIASHLQRRL